MAIDSVARGMVAESTEKLNEKIDEVEKNKSYVFDNYESMINDFNSASKTKYKIGNNIYIKTEKVPDMWVSGIGSSKIEYTYTTDDAVISALQSGNFQVGWYQFSVLETQEFWDFKMDKENPTGTGKLQIGENVTAYGEGSVAEGISDHKATDIVTTTEISDVVTAANKRSRTNEDLETITEFIETWDHIPEGEEDPDQKFSLAGGDFSSVKGANGLALAKGADAEGNGTVAAGKSSHTEGTGSKAIGHYAHAGGLETMANTYGSFVHGRDAVANRRYSAVFGRGTKDADNYSESEASGVVGALVFGKYNEPDSNGILIAGAGSNDGNRKTVHEVFKDGNKFSSWTEEDVTCGGSKNDPDVSLKQVDARLSGIILSNSQEVDNATTGGLYRVAFSYNLGNGDSNWGELLSIPYASTDTQGAYYGAQLFFATGDESGKNCLWYRTINGTFWNNWVKIDPANLQEKLVSGTNVKTVGNKSILGAGNIGFKTINFENIVGSGNISIDVSVPEKITSMSEYYDGEMPTTFDWNNFTFSRKEGRISATSGVTFTGELIIPYYFITNNEEYGVYELGYFRQQTGITELVLPNTITYINEEACKGCSGLKTIRFSNSLEYINYNAFENCTSLISLILPDGLEGISDEVFKGCTNLTEIAIPSSVTTIGVDVFYGCPNLTVYCEAGSDIATYCEDNSINYVTTYGAHLPDKHEVIANKVTSISNLSTDTQYPSAKCVWDIVGDIEAALVILRGGNVS